MHRRREPPAPVSAADCTRTFTLLADGGARVRWACGAVKVNRAEQAVDLEVLERQAWADHHHHHVLHLPRVR
jgi:hypothetical protein